MSETPMSGDEIALLAVTEACCDALGKQVQPAFIADEIAKMKGDLTAARAENAKLRAERAARGAELSAIDDALGTNEGHSAVSHIIKLRADLAAARKDAERYRWLRSKVPSSVREGLYFYFDAPMHGGGHLEATLELHRKALDAAIDAALAPAANHTTAELRADIEQLKMTALRRDTAAEDRKGETEQRNITPASPAKGYYLDTTFAAIRPDRRTQPGTRADRKEKA